MKKINKWVSSLLIPLYLGIPNISYGKNIQDEIKNSNCGISKSGENVCSIKLNKSGLMSKLISDFLNKYGEKESVSLTNEVNCFFSLSSLLRLRSSNSFDKNQGLEELQQQLYVKLDLNKQQQQDLETQYGIASTMLVKNNDSYNATSGKPKI